MNEIACKAVDIRVETWGESWVTDDSDVDFDRPMTAREIAERFGFSPHNVRDWARRHPDKVKTYRDGRRVLFIPREVLRFQANHKTGIKQ